MRIVNLKTEKNCIRIDRATKWGNPFLAAEHENSSLEYAKWLKEGEKIQIKVRGRIKTYDPIFVLENVTELRGKTLGCWCAPKRCHGEILAQLSRSEDLETELEFIISELEEKGRLS